MLLSPSSCPKLANRTKAFHRGFAEGVNYEELEAKDPDTLTAIEKIALLGKPKLGELTKVQIRIKESKEFKVITTCG